MAKSVGLEVLTRLPEANELTAILQIRGEFNHENMGPESYPGGCQITVHGKLEDGETEVMALFREIREELGDSAYMQFYYVRHNWMSLNQTEMTTNFGIFLESDFLKCLRLSPSSGGIRLITRAQVEQIQDLRQFDKKVGVTDRGITAMFADEKEALRLAFEKLA